MEIRRLLVTKDVVYSEAGKNAPRPITRAIALAVIHNPFAGRHVEDLSPLFDVGAQLAELVMPQLVALLPRKAESYGKGAIVGVNGDLEHAAALCHPKMGKPMRAALGGGEAGGTGEQEGEGGEGVADGHSFAEAHGGGAAERRSRRASPPSGYSPAARGC